MNQAQKTQIEVPNDGLNQALENLAANPRIPESVGEAALKIAEVRTNIRRPSYRLRLHGEHMATRGAAMRQRSGQRLDDQLTKTVGPLKK